MFITKGPKQEKAENNPALQKQNEELLLRVMNLEKIIMEKFGMTIKELSFRYNTVKLDAIINSFEHEKQEVEIKLDPIVVTNERSS